MNKNPGLAAILSFFVVGLGQIYNGQIGKGIFMLVSYYFLAILAWGCIFGAPYMGGSGVFGAIVLPIIIVCVWIGGMTDAYRYAERCNQGESHSAKKLTKSATSPSISVSNLGAALLVAIGMMMAYVSIPVLTIYWLIELTPMAKMKPWGKWLIATLCGLIAGLAIVGNLQTVTTDRLITAFSIGIIPALVVFFATTKKLPQDYLRLLVALVSGLLVGLGWFLIRKG
jgi:TM2 domain-containing membrane protein YozV